MAELLMQRHFIGLTMENSKFIPQTLKEADSVCFASTMTSNFPKRASKEIARDLEKSPNQKRCENEPCAEHCYMRLERKGTCRGIWVCGHIASLIDPPLYRGVVDKRMSFNRQSGRIPAHPSVCQPHSLEGFSEATMRSSLLYELHKI